MAEHECTCTNCGGREHCKIKFEPSRKCCCFWKPELKPIWIPCSESLPEKTGYYLVWTDSEIVDIAEFYTFADFVQKEIAKNYWNKESKILYWMPLPEPPEEVQG